MKPPSHSMYLTIVITLVIVGGGLAFLFLRSASWPTKPGEQILASNGIHTHDDTGEIHLEFSGVAKENGTYLSNFFGIWGKDFSSNCIFDKCNGEEGTPTMKVNGELNTEFENYAIKNGDKIEIAFNKS